MRECVLVYRANRNVFRKSLKAVLVRFELRAGSAQKTFRYGRTGNGKIPAVVNAHLWYIVPLDEVLGAAMTIYKASV